MTQAQRAKDLGLFDMNSALTGATRRSCFMERRRVVEMPGGAAVVLVWVKNGLDKGLRGNGPDYEDGYNGL